MNMLRAIQKFFLKIVKTLDYWLKRFEELILSFSILFISFLVVGNVLSRTFTGSSWHFAEELARFTLFLATFMGISYAARKGRHINMSALFDTVPFKFRKTLALLIPLVTAIVLLVVAYYAYDYVLTVKDRGRVTNALRIPYWWTLVAAPVGLVLGSLQFLRNFWINVKEKDVWLAAEQKDYDDEEDANRTGAV